MRQESYKSVFLKTLKESKRRILEGEPGYGKSTLTLQLAYDWCNDVSDSPLGKVEILILLKLRQLRGISSIYRAIKLFLLPKESRIKTGDIEEIIKASSSVNILLDGYDEYPQRDSYDNEVDSILLRKSFAQLEVTLTTRYLPQRYDCNLAERSRLTGFDKAARDEYIRKAVVGDKDEDADRIQQKIHENCILADLCQVPLIFVMFAHMANERKDFEIFHSVTNFFKYMVKCFHEHMRTKLRDVNTVRALFYENEHHELDKIAFEALVNDSQQLTWKKEKMVEKLGDSFYDQYIRIGILVEDEVMAEDSSEDKVTFITEVRFYHKLFCEWYAAHHLARLGARPDTQFANWTEEFEEKEVGKNDILHQLDPSDLQYL